MHCLRELFRWPVVQSAPASATASPDRNSLKVWRGSPEAQNRLFTPFLITVSLVEATFFINVAFMALFVFATPGR
jgi:hypothetical protein